MQLAAVSDDIRSAGAALWAVSPQRGDLNLALRQRRQLTFPILADANQAVIRRWGLYDDLDVKQRPIPYPATYIVDQERRVAWRHLGMQPRERPTPGQILAALPYGPVQYRASGET